jgi:hypothetical protein
MAGGYWDVILITFVGFVALAAALLIPVWRFLSREEQYADQFTGDVSRDQKEGGPAWLGDVLDENFEPPADE